MSSVVRGFANAYTRFDGVFEIHVLSEPSKVSGQLSPVTVLIHDGDRRGEFEPWMVDFMEATAEEEDDGDMPISAASCREIVAALETLWKERDDDG